MSGLINLGARVAQVLAQDWAQHPQTILVMERWLGAWEKLGRRQRKHMEARWIELGEGAWKPMGQPGIQPD